MSTPQQPQVRVGVAAFVLEHPPEQHLQGQNPPRFLVGTRKGSHGAGKLALPGGHLEPNESFQQCATREVLEETGLHVTNLAFLTATNDIMAEEGKHYVTIFMTCERVDAAQEARLLEPEKCEGWRWVEWGELFEMVEREGEGVFLPLRNLVRERRGCLPPVGAV